MKVGERVVMSEGGGESGDVKGRSLPQWAYRLVYRALDTSLDKK